MVKTNLSTSSRSGSGFKIRQEVNFATCEPGKSFNILTIGDQPLYEQRQRAQNVPRREIRETDLSSPFRLSRTRSARNIQLLLLHIISAKVRSSIIGLQNSRTSDTGCLVGKIQLRSSRGDLMECGLRMA